MITVADVLDSPTPPYFPSALNVYSYGSRVYGTNKENSDHDYIVIADIDTDSGQDETGNITIYSPKAFQDRINDHEISALECLSLQSHHIHLKTIDFEFELDLPTLRRSISHKASNSWVKCKKKLTVPKDFDSYVGKKSLFHSLRIISFGIQIAQYGKIKKFDSVNYFYDDIIYCPSCDWDYYKTKYKPIFNNMMTEFRKLAPKK